MERADKKCFKHNEITAKFYCPECKIYICNECESPHSNFFSNHKEINLENDDCNDIYTEFCKVVNHFDKLEYFCKTHNVLCCAACITKIKSKDKGQHKDCEIYEIEKIKDTKLNSLRQYIQELENLSTNLKDSVNGFKILFERISNNKNELKLKIQEVFKMIVNKIKDRENELLLEVENKFEEKFINENKMNEIDKLPNKIKSILDKKLQIENALNSGNDIISLVNKCINIENNIKDIQEMKNIFEKCNNNINFKFSFFPEKMNDLDEIFGYIMSFEEIYDNNININDNEEKINIDSTIEIGNISNSINYRFSIDFKGFTPNQYNQYFNDK